jgi:hypothetical protein
MGREVTLSLRSIIAGSAVLTLSLIAHIVSFSFYRHIWERSGTIPPLSSAALYKGLNVQVIHNLRPHFQFQ